MEKYTFQTDSRNNQISNSYLRNNKSLEKKDKKFSTSENLLVTMKKEVK